MKDVDAKPTEATTVMVPKEGEMLLNPDAILVAEYEYISETAFQAHEDRARVTTFYLVTVGSLVAAILTTQAERFQVIYVYWGFGILFSALTLSAILTLLQLARLRQAWFESAVAMNEIKDFYIEHTQEINLEDAFRWRKSTIPARFKPWSVSFLLTIQVALLGGVAFGATILFVGLGFFYAWWWGWSIGLGIAFFALEVLLDWLILK